MFYIKSLIHCFGGEPNKYTHIRTDICLTSINSIFLDGSQINTYKTFKQKVVKTTQINKQVFIWGTSDKLKTSTKTNFHLEWKQNNTIALICCSFLEDDQIDTYKIFKQKWNFHILYCLAIKKTTRSINICVLYKIFDSLFWRRAK